VLERSRQKSSRKPEAAGFEVRDDGREGQDHTISKASEEARSRRRSVYHAHELSRARSPIRSLDRLPPVAAESAEPACERGRAYTLPVTRPAGSRPSRSPRIAR